MKLISKERQMLLLDEYNRLVSEERQMLLLDEYNRLVRLIPQPCRCCGYRVCVAK